MESGDPSAVVAEAALDSRDARAAQALDMFVSVYGAEAGNLALKALAVGGIFVGGGIAPKIRPKLEDGSFVTALRDKGRLSGMMAYDSRAPRARAADGAPRRGRRGQIASIRGRPEASGRPDDLLAAATASPSHVSPTARSPPTSGRSAT